MLTFVLPAAARAGVAPVTTHQGILITDIHFDPLADPSIVPQLISSPISGWDAIFAPDANNPFAAPGQDSNYSLMNSALENAKAEVPGDDIVICTGDLLRHNFQAAFNGVPNTTPDEYPCFAVKTEEYVVQKLQATLGANVVFAFGNNDSVEGDYIMPPNNKMFAALAKELTLVAASSEAQETCEKGGYYSIAHPNVANQDIVVLNSVFWSVRYQDSSSGESDPGMDELNWLDSTLAAAQSKGRTVTLVMHIPPGDDTYKSASGTTPGAFVPLWKKDFTHDYASIFFNIMKKYNGVVQIAFAGHTHMDDFRVMYDGDTPFLPLRITPSVSPILYNNPAFSEYDYASDTGDVSDITTYDSSAAPNKAWPQEYVFSKIYHYSSFNATNLSFLATSIRAGGTARQNWETFYAASAASPIKDSNWPIYAYAQTRLTEGEYIIGTLNRP